jgi:hypothetical protein
MDNQKSMDLGAVMNKLRNTKVLDKSEAWSMLNLTATTEDISCRDRM